METLNIAQYYNMNHYIYACTSLSNHTESLGMLKHIACHFVR